MSTRVAFVGSMIFFTKAPTGVRPIKRAISTEYVQKNVSRASWGRLWTILAACEHIREPHQYTRDIYVWQNAKEQVWRIEYWREALRRVTAK